MASKNSLLGSGMHEPTPAPFGHGLINVRAPAWRFHTTLCPKGKIVQFDAELDKLDAEGWVDHIGKTKRLPGLERIWDNYQASLKQAEEETPVPVVPVERILTEDEITANELKAESDRLEAKRLADLEKAQAGPPKCPICSKEFDTERAMLAHKRLAHKGE
jgi:DNA repair exonuclease SbcCD ATPase subunit